MRNFFYTAFISVTLANILFGVGTSTYTRTSMFKDGQSGRPVKIGDKFTVTWTADASDGSVPDVAIPMYGFVVKVVTNPGGTAPTDNYDIALEDPDDNALDALGGLLADRDTSTTEQVYPVITGAATPVFVNGTYNSSLSNNSVNSATGEIHYYVVFP